ncbi:MAG: GDSL-type esterase/lipase family protein [Helicobacteraceae bacterium]|jgi:lysophospholipase L1-like esterase|nr:GDSL-type esterase/lipase family protein [Helicobacteraceae bacterium]
MAKAAIELYRAGLRSICLAAVVFAAQLNAVQNTEVKQSSAIYKNNPRYEGRNGLFRIYKSDGVKAVMLGDSITEWVEWNELLSRDDIANRGIAADITEGFLNRLDEVYRLKPKLCFIMGGINDITRGIPTETAAANIEKIIDELQKRKIEAIVQSTLYVAQDFQRSAAINKNVDELNDKLKAIAAKKGVLFINLNEKLAKNGSLDMKYTYDGAHLNGAGYERWRDLIAPIIEKPVN